MSISVIQKPDADLYEPLLNGEPGGLELTYDRYGGLAYGLALRILGDSGRAEDVVQEAFTTVWKRSSSFDPDRGTFRTWLLTIVRNRSIDVLRGRSTGRSGELELPQELPDKSPTGDPWHTVSLSMERAEVRTALEALPAEQRQAIELAYFGGNTHMEIAELLHLPLGTVKGRIRLGLEKLHSYLSGRGFLEA